MQEITKIFCSYIYLITGFFFLSFPSYLEAQQPVFISHKADLFFHAKDSIGIFGNVVNNGRLGSAPGAIINFFGKQWKNSSSSLLPGKHGIQSEGGIFRFAGRVKQKLKAGYDIHNKKGPSFPNLSIENLSGILLQQANDLHIRGNLYFQKGHLVLHGQNILVEGDMSGYSDKAFVVTGKEIDKGNLYRSCSTTANEMIVFPIGTDSRSYSPLGIKATTALNRTIGAGVFNHVYKKAVKGSITDSNVVRKTWETKAIEGLPGIEIFLQHEVKDEGTLFSYYRDSSYISLYHAEEGYWDVDSLTRSIIHPGTLTTTRPENDDFLNHRIFLHGLSLRSSDSFNWFSVSTSQFSSQSCPVAHFILWAARRYNGERIQLFWRTTFEQNVISYEVQRRMDTSSTFRTIHTVTGQGRNGFSNKLCYYYAKDKKAYDGWIYYRLKLTGERGCTAFTQERSVAWGIDVKVWPNPNPDGNVHIKVSGITHSIHMQLIDAGGQRLGNYYLHNNQTLHLNNLAAAIYFLVFRDPKKGNHKIRTIKLVVQ